MYPALPITSRIDTSWRPEPASVLADDSTADRGVFRPKTSFDPRPLSAFVCVSGHPGRGLWVVLMTALDRFWLTSGLTGDHVSILYILILEISAL